MNSQLILILLCLMSLSAAAANVEPASFPKENPSTEVSGTSHPYHTAAVALTATVLIGVGVVALTALFFPVTAYRICYALGGCQSTMDSYVDDLIGKQLGRARNIKNKRSVEYIEPILMTLAKAYEEYSGEDVKKNFKIPSYYTK